MIIFFTLTTFWNSVFYMDMIIVHLYKSSQTRIQFKQHAWTRANTTFSADLTAVYSRLWVVVGIEEETYFVLRFHPQHSPSQRVPLACLSATCRDATLYVAHK